MGEQGTAHPTGAQRKGRTSRTRYSPSLLPEFGRIRNQHAVHLPTRAMGSLSSPHNTVAYREAGFPPLRSQDGRLPLITTEEQNWRKQRTYFSLIRLGLRRLFKHFPGDFLQREPRFSDCAILFNVGLIRDPQCRSRVLPFRAQKGSSRLLVCGCRPTCRVVGFVASLKKSIVRHLGWGITSSTMYVLLLMMK